MSLVTDRELSPAVPAARVRVLNDREVRPDGGHVLYWMTAFRRLEWNFALQRAVAWANALGRPLVILEALSCNYPHASARFQRFVLEGMAAHAARVRASQAAYYPYLETRPGAGRGLVDALAARAAVVVGDDSPAFFLPRLSAGVAARCPVRFEAVDSYGLFPLDAAPRPFATARGFRGWAEAELGGAMDGMPEPEPLEWLRSPRPATVPSDVLARWPAVEAAALAEPDGLLRGLPVDRRIGAGWAPGGAPAGEARLTAFLREGLWHHGTRPRDLMLASGSGLSPYLHFGHLSAHQVLAGALAATDAIGGDRAAAGWSLWPELPVPVAGFLDELVVWRELAANAARHLPEYAAYHSLPEWARRTLAHHAGDPRGTVYDLARLEGAETDDPLWNAAQRQLMTEGRMPNRLRMLWGKKVLQWSESPEAAFETLLLLNDRYALDGRDPNSVAGVAWVFGRYDRAWGPERPVFGTIRYMSSVAMTRKFPVRAYLARYGREAA